MVKTMTADALMDALSNLAVLAKFIEMNSAEDGESEKAQGIREGLEELLENLQ